jgi:glycosyltransferase involved in cell wall biosynthesis
MEMKKLIKVSTVPMSLDTFCRGQLKMLSEYYEVIAISSPDKELESIRIREEVRTISVPMERHISIFKDIKSLIKMICVFHREKPDIVHSMTPKAGLISMLAAWICRVPVRMHTYTGLVFPTATGLKQTILIWMDKLLCACATYINPEGNGVKKDLIKFGITKKPLHIIANGNVRGIDIEYYTCNSDVMNRASILRDDSKFTFCFVGRLVGDKGINELIAAFEKLKDKGAHHIRLLMVGPKEANLDPLKRDTIEVMDEDDDIYLYGSQADVRPYYAASDAFVFPSYREGFPNTVLEAGAMDLPSIVTDINGSNEIISDKENGLIIPAHDADALYHAMKYFVENKDEIGRMGTKAREVIEQKFEQKMIWGELLKVYQSFD